MGNSRIVRRQHLHSRRTGGAWQRTPRLIPEFLFSPKRQLLLHCPVTPKVILFLPSTTIVSSRASAAGPRRSGFSAVVLTSVPFSIGEWMVHVPQHLLFACCGLPLRIEGRTLTKNVRRSGVRAGPCRIFNSLRSWNVGLVDLPSIASYHFPRWLRPLN